MRVIILGAGASCEAGYPLASNLMNSIRDKALSTSDVLCHDSWEKWEEYRASTSDIIKSLVCNSNPEVVLSVADLFDIAIQAEDREQFEAAAKKLEEQSGEALDDYDKYLESPLTKQMHDAPVARDHFLKCLDYFFRSLHVRDSKTLEPRDYLRKLFRGLHMGDVVITLNWDTTAERTLCEAGLWNPTDGYGIQKKLLYYPTPFAMPQELPHDFPRTSVKVLKLHGSFGWRVKEGEDVERNEEPQIIFSEAGYLQHLPFKHGNCNYVFEDFWKGSRADLEKLALLYPSFLKRIEIPQLQTIWHEASAALCSADEVDIWGYSLPESDMAIRVLLNCLRFRSQSGEAQVIVHDKNDDTLDRWRAFLGEKAIYRCEALQ